MQNPGNVAGGEPVVPERRSRHRRPRPSRRRRYRSLLITIPFAIVLFVLAIKASVSPPESIFLWFVFYSPLGAVAMVVRIPIEGPLLYLLVLFLLCGPVYHFAWAFFVDLGIARGGRARVALGFFLVWQGFLLLRFLKGRYVRPQASEPGRPRTGS